MERSTSRREFFSRVTPKPALVDLPLLRAGRAAMGTQFEVILPNHLRSHMESIHFALDEVRRLEGLMTVFDSESRVSEVNREAAMNPVAAAYANAIHNALGIRFYELPITPEKILSALQEKKGSK